MASLNPKLLILLFITSSTITSANKKSRSHKKGLCIPPGQRLYCGDFGKFSRASWWYNWHVEPNHHHDGWCHCPATNDSCGEPPAQLDFIPMVWGYHEEGNHNHHDDINDPVDEMYPIILGFNEPNKEDQSDMSPEEAASHWLELQEMYPDRILVSPAPAGGNTNWFDPFSRSASHSGVE